MVPSLGKTLRFACCHLVRHPIEGASGQVNVNYYSVFRGKCQVFLFKNRGKFRGRCRSFLHRDIDLLPLLTLSAPKVDPVPGKKAVPEKRRYFGRRKRIRFPGGIGQDGKFKILPHLQQQDRFLVPGHRGRSFRLAHDPYGAAFYHHIPPTIGFVLLGDGHRPESHLLLIALHQHGFCHIKNQYPEVPHQKSIPGSSADTDSKNLPSHPPCSDWGHPAVPGCSTGRAIPPHSRTPP